MTLHCRLIDTVDAYRMQETEVQWEDGNRRANEDEVENTGLNKQGVCTENRQRQEVGSET